MPVKTKKGARSAPVARRGATPGRTGPQEHPGMGSPVRTPSQEAHEPYLVRGLRDPVGGGIPFAER